MKKKLLIFMLILPVLFILLHAFKASGPYKDGVYKGTSRSRYIQENFWGTSVVTIEKGYITKVDFSITDSTKKEIFDSKYEKYFTDNKEYTDQCRNDWKGVQNYPAKLVKYQKLNNIDAVSGATWSYNIFKAATEIALKKALIK